MSELRQFKAKLKKLEDQFNPLKVLLRNEKKRELSVLDDKLNNVRQRIAFNNKIINNKTRSSEHPEFKLENDKLGIKEKRIIKKITSRKQFT